MLIQFELQHLYNVLLRITVVRWPATFSVWRNVILVDEGIACNSHKEAS